MKRRYWSEADDALLRELYPNSQTKSLCAVFDRNAASIYNRVHLLGLKKSAEYLASEMSGRLTARNNHGTRFKPGQRAWNKGMKGLDMNNKETRFKPGVRMGMAALNWKPLGFERLSKDGYLERKVADTGSRRTDFVGVHRLLWLAAGREIPEGYRLVFRDGDKTNIQLDNLELVTAAELLLRNTVHNYPEELKAVMRLKGVLTRKINERGNHEQHD